DPKQSIYGFRRADPETYDAMTARLTSAGAERRILVDQYRSDPELLETMNVMFTRLFAKESSDPNVFWPPYHELRAAKDWRTGAASPVRTGEGASPPMTLIDGGGDRFIGEAEAIARWIHAHGAGDFRRFAILFRRMTQIDDYLDVFDREAIPYVLPPTRMFLDRRAPVDLLAVLRAIAFPFDRGAMISAARTPYFGLTDEEIVTGVIPDPSPGLRPPSPGGRGVSAESGPYRLIESLLPPGEGARRADEGRVISSAWTSFTEAIHAYASKQCTVSELIDFVIAT